MNETSTVENLINWSPAVLLWLLCLGIMMIPYVKIIRKAGYSGWWTLVVLVPLVNIVMLWVFAFAKWPLERQARHEDVF